MTTPASTLARPRRIAAWRSLALPGVAFGLALLVLLALFYPEGRAAIRTWLDSTAYNHCFLVIPIAAYLLWDRRATLHDVTLQPMPLAALLGLPIGIAWLAAERLGIMEGRQLAALSFAELLVFCLLGWRSWRLVSGPLLYLYFLVPFGDFLTPKLQDVTTVFIRHGLSLLQIPAYIDGYTIEIPEGSFYVAEACAGLRFLIASIAFGCLYALIMYRSPMRRTLFILASIIVPVIANGFRALGIVVLGHILGSAQAAATDHVLYGWIFFSLVILMLIGLGMPFRQDEMMPASRTWSVPHIGHRPARLALVAAVAVAVVAAVSPAVALGLNRATLPPAAMIRLLPGEGCTQLPVPQAVAVGTPGRLVTEQFACGAQLFDVRIEAFSRRITSGPLMAERHRLTRMPDSEDTVEEWLDTPAGSDRVWRIIRASKPYELRAVAMWVDGKPARPGLGLRLHMALSSLTGATHLPVLVTVAPAVDWTAVTLSARRQLEQAMADFLVSHAAFSAEIAAQSAVVR